MSGHEQAADALDDERVRAGGGARAAPTSSAGSIGVPASSAARCGETGGPKRRRDRRGRPAAAASSSWSGGHAGSGGSSVPVTTGLNAATRSPRAPQRRGDRRGDHGLADPGVGPGDEEAAQRPLRALPRARRARGAAAARARAASCAVTIGSAAPGWKPAASAARASVWAASRSSPRVCEAITASRSREVPSGTVGGRIAWAKTPALERRLADRHRQVRRRRRQRHDLGLRAGDLEALAGELGRAASSALAWSFSTRRGCSRSSSSAASAPATAGGGRRGREDQRARGVDEVLRHLVRRSRRRRRRSRAPCRACRR